MLLPPPAGTTTPQDADRRRPRGRGTGLSLLGPAVVPWQGRGQSALSPGSYFPSHFPQPELVPPWAVEGGVGGEWGAGGVVIWMQGGCGCWKTRALWPRSWRQCWASRQPAGALFPHFLGMLPTELSSSLNTGCVEHKLEPWGHEGPFEMDSF